MQGFRYKSIRLIKVCMIIIICSLLFVQEISILATPKEDLQQEINANKNKLDEVQNTISQYEAQRLELEMQIDSQKSEMINLMRMIVDTEASLEAKQVEIEEAQVAYDEACIERDEQYAAMVVRLQYMYEAGEEDALVLLLTATSFDAFLNRAEYVEHLYAYDQAVLDEYEQLMVEVKKLQENLVIEQENLEITRDELKAQETELDRIMGELESKVDDFDVLVSDAQSVAAVYKNNISNSQSQLNTILQQEAADKEAADKEAADKEAANAEQNTTVNGNVSGSTGSELGKKIASYALQFVGNPYVWGGSSLSTGADCSGFVMAVYSQFGYSLPHSSYSLRSSGKEVSLSNIEPGDLVCYSGHVAMYIGDGRIVHAKSSSTGTVTDPIYYGWGGTGPTVLTVRRII